jgi:hypothetical protein
MLKEPPKIPGNPDPNPPVLAAASQDVANYQQFLPPATAEQAQTAVNASKKLNALYTAHDAEGLHEIIVRIRQRLYGKISSGEMDAVDAAILGLESAG